MLNLTKKRFDIIIIGAGLSGLILQMKSQRNQKKVFSIVEKKKNLATIRIGVFGIHHKISLQINMIQLGTLKIKIDNNEIIHKERNIRCSSFKIIFVFQIYN